MLILFTEVDPGNVKAGWLNWEDGDLFPIGQ